MEVAFSMPNAIFRLPLLVIIISNKRSIAWGRQMYDKRTCRNVHRDPCKYAYRQIKMIYVEYKKYNEFTKKGDANTS